jgi:ankyrin repeat protein
MCEQFQRLLAAALILALVLQSCNPNANLPITQVSWLLTEDSKDASESFPSKEDMAKNYLTQTNLALHPSSQASRGSHLTTINPLSSRSLFPLEEIQKDGTWKMNNTSLVSSSTKVLPIYAYQREDVGQKSLGNQKVYLAKLHIPRLPRLHNSKEQKLLVPCIRLYEDLNEEKESRKPQNGLSLHQAAQQGNIEVFKQILDRIMDPHIPDLDGYTPLHYAAKHGHLEVADFLLTKKGADPNIGDCYGATPLHIAAANGHVAVVDLLLQKNANFNKTEQLYGYTPLHYAAERGHTEVIQLLLNNRAVFKATTSGFTPLHVAAREPFVKVVKLLLDSGIDVNIVNTSNGSTPLHVAAEKNGNLEVIKLLLARGANTNQVDRARNTPLYIAAKYGHLKVVELLLDNGAKPNIANKNGYTPLHIAAEHGHLKVVQWLLDRGAKPNTAKRDGTTPLYIAAKYGHLKVVQWLLDRGAKPNAAKRDGTTPLYIAAKHGHLEVVQLLLAMGANPNKANNQGYTPLHIVAEASIYPEITAFHRMNSSVTAPRYHPNKELHNIVAIIHSLLEGGADLNAQNNNGDTFLHTIVARKKIDLFMSLKLANTHACVLKLLQDSTVHSEVDNDIFSIILEFFQEVNWDLKNKQGKTIKHLIQDMTSSQQEYEKILHQLNLKVE